MKTLLIILSAAIMIVGCTPKGPAQREGEKIDLSLTNATGGTKNPFKEGPVEKMGKAVDGAASDVKADTHKSDKP